MVTIYTKMNGTAKKGWRDMGACLERCLPHFQLCLEFYLHQKPSHSTKGVWAEGTVMVWKKNVPHRLLYLNMWSPVGSTGSRLWASPHSFFSLLPVCRAWIWVRHLTVSFLFPRLYNKAPKVVSGTVYRETHCWAQLEVLFPWLIFVILNCVYLCEGCVHSTAGAWWGQRCWLLQSWIYRQSWAPDTGARNQTQVL